MAWGNMHKTSTLFSGHMATGQQWHVKLIPICGHGMGDNCTGQFMSDHYRTNGHGLNAKFIRYRVT